MTKATHTRRGFLKTASLHAALLAVPGCAELQWPSPRAPDRPNIVLIMADDMGYSDIGCYGSEIKTPNLDRLAANGLRFTQFYNTARCCPTRACLLTGLYPHQAGIGHMMNDRNLDGYRGDLNNSCVTIAEALKTSGYATYMSGKWHITRQVGHWSGNKNLTSKHNWPCQRGFDRFYGIIHGSASFFDPITLTRDNEPIEPESEKYYFTDAISDNASQFITDHTETKTKTPFFCYVSYTAPHWPLHALPEDIERYKGRYDKGWDALRTERHQRMIRMGIVDKKWKLTPRDKNAPTWENAKNKSWQARRMEVYAAQIDRMDQGIGRIVKTLEKTGQLHNTLIFFLADNGGCAEELGGKRKALHIPEKTRDGRPVQPGNKPELMPGPEETYQSYGLPWANASNTPFRRYKHWVHEGGVASPLIVHWPKHLRHKNKFRKHPAHLIDIMPTTLAAANAPYPKDYKGNSITPLPGVSLLPAFDNKPLNRKAIFFEHEGNRAVRYKNWKLVAKGPYGPWELYNLTKDRTETNNLTSAYPGKTLQLAKMWNDWAKRSNVLPWPWKKPKKPDKNKKG